MINIFLNVDSKLSSQKSYINEQNVHENTQHHVIRKMQIKSIISSCYCYIHATKIAKFVKIDHTNYW